MANIIRIFNLLFMNANMIEQMQIDCKILHFPLSFHGLAHCII